MGGSAKHHFDAGRDALSDIDCSCGVSASDKILENISKSITNHYIVNSAENRLWNQEREAAADKLGFKVSLVLEFLCSPHPLGQFTHVADKETKASKAKKSIPQVFKQGRESDMHALLWRLSNLIYKDGTRDPLMISPF